MEKILTSPENIPLAQRRDLTRDSRGHYLAQKGSEFPEEETHSLFIDGERGSFRLSSSLSTELSWTRCFDQTASVYTKAFLCVSVVFGFLSMYFNLTAAIEHLRIGLWLGYLLAILMTMMGLYNLYTCYGRSVKGKVDATLTTLYLSYNLLTVIVLFSDLRTARGEVQRGSVSFYLISYSVALVGYVVMIFLGQLHGLKEISKRN